MRTVTFPLILAFLSPLLVHSQTMGPVLKKYLESSAKLTPAEFADIAAGKGVARILDAPSPDEIGVLGIVHVKVPPDFLFSSYTNFENAQTNNGGDLRVLFSKPPKPADLARLTLEPNDFKALSKCKPGDCGFQIGAAGIARFQNDVDWKAPDAKARAEAVLRELMANGMAAYQQKGEEAMITYQDQRTALSAREGFRKLMADTPELTQGLPNLSKYLLEFPTAGFPHTKDYFFWSKTDFGADIVTALGHAVLHEEKQGNRSYYIVAVKTLAASHYIRSGITLRFLIPPAGQEDKPKSHYIVNLSRVQSEGLTGMKGKLARGLISGKMRDNLTSFMTDTKSMLETWYEQNTAGAR